MKTIEVGDILYVLPISNALRWGQKPFQVKVEKIGKKYLYLQKENGSIFDEKVSKSDLTITSNYSANYILFQTEKERQDDEERPKNVRYIENNIGRLSNDDLVKIISIIDETK